MASSAAAAITDLLVQRPSLLFVLGVRGLDPGLLAPAIALTACRPELCRRGVKLLAVEEGLYLRGVTGGVCPLLRSALGTAPHNCTRAHLSATQSPQAARETTALRQGTRRLQSAHTPRELLDAIASQLYPPRAPFPFMHYWTH